MTVHIPAIHLPNGRDLFRPLPYRPAEFKRVLKQYAERGLLECTAEDTIVLPSRPDDDYLRFLLDNGIGTEKIVICNGTTGNLASDLLEDTLALSQLEGKGIPSFYIHLEEEVELAKMLGTVTTHPVITRMANRYYFLARIAEDLDVTMPPLVQVRSGRFTPPALQLLDKWKKLFVRGNESVGGIHAFAVSTPEDVARIDKIISRNSHINRYFISPFLEGTESWNVQYHLADKVSFFGASRQVLEGGTAHKGNVADDLPPERIRHAARVIIDRLFDLGMKGHVGIDLITKDDTVYPVDINARKNTSTPALTVLNRLKATGKNVVMKSFGYATPGGLTFAQFTERAGKETLFNASDGHGFLPFHLSSSRMTSKLDVAVFAETMQEAETLEHYLRSA